MCTRTYIKRIQIRFKLKSVYLNRRFSNHGTLCISVLLELSTVLELKKKSISLENKIQKFKYLCTQMTKFIEITLKIVIE